MQDSMAMTNSTADPARLPLRDPIAGGALLVLGLASLPMFLPVFSETWQVVYGARILDLSFLSMVLCAIGLRLRRVDEPRERRFWQLLAVGMAAWLFATISSPIVDALGIPRGPLHALLKNGPYLLLYAAIAAALEIHPHVRHDPVFYPLRILEWAGSFLLLFGLLVYFLVIPSVTYKETSAFWASSLALFVTFDAYIILRLWRHRRMADSSEWRAIYGWLLTGVIVWSLGDLCLALMYEGIMVDPGFGSMFDLIWPAAFVAIVVATRATVGQFSIGVEDVAPQQSQGMGPLVVYIMAPLLLHIALYQYGMPEFEFREARADLVLALTAVLGLMTLAYHRTLRRENSKLADQEVLAKQVLAHQAFHDELTGLPNRNLFRDRLRLAIADSSRYQTKCGVLFCDLDQFKAINDSLGHEAGDQALITAAERLQASIRRKDTVARLGGDEFAIIVQDMHRGIDAAHLAEKLLAALEEPFMLGQKSHVLTASIGIAIYPDDSEEEEVLLKHADTAMYQAKLHGRNTYRLFTDAMNEAAEERLAIEQGLRSGLIEDRFRIYYQPIVALESGQVVAFEALLRWNHPQRGYVSPVNFLDVAEQTGLILPIGRWVLKTACSWVAQLGSNGGVLPSVSVNMSARQFRDPTLVQEIADTLHSTGLDPSRLQLEVTESLALTVASTAAMLKQLQKLGVRISIDDFGTGYAALSHLQDLPVDIVKIDRSFVKGIEIGSVSEAIVLAIVNMARALDFYVVAEGVETESELEVVRQSRCHAVQGYYLCKPQPAQELEKRLATGEPGFLPVTAGPADE